MITFGRYTEAYMHNSVSDTGNIEFLRKQEKCFSRKDTVMISGFTEAISAEFIPARS